ncbi:(+)-neomenthol dehydrogenase-like isoform X1 [Brachypodium distachyon]|uniref:(+)-neomenthol dehydrogenase-like isoform X1 n=1 Tax=Brachypodium distachyon TaxID=15368 RepID=UPI000D0D8A86|nr:(+)-neomenthol dehydrogenase-like isoform X1 [Brachypodium distachyon]|eukprot:XP_024312164.1 (+)-neomenthol dehydrogenase-like isoform X1 [Brachypodium distachyon]
MEGAISKPPYTRRIAVVTGGNKGIGLEVCRQLASDGVTVVLTARDEKRGADAVEKLKALGLCDILFHQLEITDSSSIAALADFLKTRFGRLDILVNNAAVSGVEHVQEVDTNEEKFNGMDLNQRLEWVLKNIRDTVDGAKKSIQTNYYGTKHVIDTLLPLLQSSNGGRIANVTSAYGLLRVSFFLPPLVMESQIPVDQYYHIQGIFFYAQRINNEEIRQELDDIENLTEERLDELLGKFLKDFEADALEMHGWPVGLAAYKVAKAAMNAYSRILARRNRALRINCVHPGYVKTDMSMSSGVLTPEEGARSVVNVALLPDGGPTGAYFAMGQEASFV